MRIFQFMNILFVTENIDVKFKHDDVVDMSSYDEWHYCVNNISFDAFKAKYPFWSEKIERLYLSKAENLLMIEY